jgi:hypothetical protein
VFGRVQPTAELFAGIRDLINARLGVRDYRTKTAALMLVAQASGTLDGEDFVQSLFELLRENWLRALAAAKPRGRTSAGTPLNSRSQTATLVLR